MPASPSTATTQESFLQLTIHVDGSPLSDSLLIEAIHVRHEINTISSAEVWLTGLPLADSAAIDLWDEAPLAPGNAITISAGYGDDAVQPLFTGRIIRQELELEDGGFMRCRLVCRHHAVVLSQSFHFRSFSGKTDSAVIRAVLNDYPLSATVEEIFDTHESLVQMSPTDWDLVLARAAFNGFLVFMDGTDSITIGKPGTSGSPVLSLAAGDSMLSFSGALSAELHSALPGTNAPAGTVRFVGNAKVATGNLITLEGVGKRFNGDAFVSGVFHNIADAVWVTTARFGLDSPQVAGDEDKSSSNTAGQLPAIHGFRLAVVQKLSGDPQGIGRIRVRLQADMQEVDGIWARLSSAYATNGAGMSVYPEIGDEVVVGFVEADPRYPVIIGSLYGLRNTAPGAPADENNYLKKFTSKSGVSITLDDQKHSLTLATPAGNSIAVSDDGKSIELNDQNGNIILMNGSGITIKSAGDIIFSATGNLQATATGDVDLTATQDLNAAGLNVNLAAQMALTARGIATAELSANGQTTVKGVMVMIN